MIRNLVLKLPTLKCTSDYAFSTSLRPRNFRSLSPVQRVRTSAISERSVSCSRAESGHIVDISRTPRARTLCFSKECFGQKHDDTFKEIQWREEPSKPDKKDEMAQFESLEQYELEAAKPRPIKSRDVIEALTTKQNVEDGFLHLQPSQIKPYGSQDNIYSPSLLGPTNLLKYPRRFKKLEKKDTPESEKKSSTDLDGAGYRRYSTSSDVRKVSTSKSYVAKEGGSSKDKIVSSDIQKFSTSKSYVAKEGSASKDKISISSETHTNKQQKDIDNLKFLASPKQVGETNFNVLKYVQQSNKEPWSEPKQRLEFSPPVFRPRNCREDGVTPFRFSTEKERRQRRENENRNRNLYYRSSYSDLVKLKLKEAEVEKQKLLSPIPFDPKVSTRTCPGCFLKNPQNSSQMLQVNKNPPEKRTLTTRSKSNILSKEPSPAMLYPITKTALLSKKSVDESPEQRNYSKSKSKPQKTRKTKNSNPQDLREYNPNCENICTPLLKSLRSKKYTPYEPKQCESNKVIKKVYLPSHVKLPVPPCTPKPEYKDCKKVEPCPPRADACLMISPKKLPKLPLGNCPCLEPPLPSKAPKLEKLNLKFEDPPKVVCHPPPCQTPRADDANPYKFKPLKPYVPGECDCIQPPPMKDVKLKRLPRCAPEEVCRPQRVCPVIEKCPPRADECLKIVPKHLPPLDPSHCPCVEPHIPTVAPPLKKLDLKAPDPPRVCPKPPLCKEKERADDNLRLKKKKLPKFVPGDCPCEDRPMIDWNLRRLVCEDEPADCVVPDPCKTFPRADWGCWEYQDELCEVLDEKCIEKNVDCPPPKPPRSHPCDRHDPCVKQGIKEIRHMPKRKYSNSSASMKLYQQIKTQNFGDDVGYIKTTANTYKPPKIEPSKPKIKRAKSQKDTKTATTRGAQISTKLKCKSTVSLIKMLNDLERCKKDYEDPLLFKPVHDEKVNYDKILEKIASSTVMPDKRELETGTLGSKLKRSKSNTIKVTSRAISTSKNIFRDEIEMRHEKECEGKKKCKNIRPSIKSLMCNKKCPKIPTCGTGEDNFGSCKKDRVPVCCEKEEPPYSAYTDNLPHTIKPFTTKTPQWTCNRVQYGFHPYPKKEYEAVDESRKQDKKNFSTCALINGIPVYSSPLAVHSNTNRPTTTMSSRFVSLKLSGSLPAESPKGKHF